jgi:hypothetical protein
LLAQLVLLLVIGLGALARPGLAGLAAGPGRGASPRSAVRPRVGIGRALDERVALGGRVEAGDDDHAGERVVLAGGASTSEQAAAHAHSLPMVV